MKLRYIVLFLVFFLQIGSCVSIQFKSSETKKIRHFEYQNLSPFKKMNSETSLAFQSQKTGHIIAVESHCPVEQDPWGTELPNTLSERERVGQWDNLMIEDRPASLTRWTGKKEALPYQLAILKYEKWGCRIYALYFGRSETFEQEWELFRQWIHTLKSRP